MGAVGKIAAEMIPQIKASSSSFLSSRMLSKHPLEGPMKIVKRLANRSYFKPVTKSTSSRHSKKDGPTLWPSPGMIFTVKEPPAAS